MPSIGSDRKTGAVLEKYADRVHLRDDVKFYFGNDGDASMEYDEDGTDRVILSGAFTFDETITLAAGQTAPAPGLRVVSDLISFSDTVVSGGTSIAYLSDCALPEGAIVVGSKIEVTTGFTGGSISQAAATVGSAGNDLDAYNGGTGTLDVFQSDTDVGGSAIAGPEAFSLSDTIAELSITYTGGVHSDVAAGDVKVNVYYLVTE